jgi:hypothetical protein
VLLPAKRGDWRLVSGPHALDLEFTDLQEEGIISYDVAEDVHVLFDLGTVTKALYKNNMYPDLTDKQVFSIRNIMVDNNKKLVTIVGNILENI